MRPNIRIARHRVQQLSITMVLAFIAAGCADSGPTTPRTVTPRGPSFARSQRSYSLRSIDIPGARGTTPQGINANGDIVGFFTDAGGAVHGFLLHGGVLDTIDHRNAAGQRDAAYTDARGISPSGEIVGSYRIAGEPGVAAHGYLRTVEGGFVPVHFPGHLYEFLQRILPDGTILGCRHDMDLMDDMHGIVIDRHGDEDGGLDNSMNNGATPSRRLIVGHHVTPTFTEAYVIENGARTYFRKPGSTSTTAWDVNPAGEIAGVYVDTRAHGFVRSGDATYVTLDYPGSTATRAFGINAGGAVVGNYSAGGITHGFLATPDA